MSEFRWSEFQKRMKDADPDYRIIALTDVQIYLTTLSALAEEPQAILMQALVTTFGPKEPNNEVHSTSLSVLPPTYRLLSVESRAKLVALLGRYMDPTDDDFNKVDEYYRKGSMRENAAMGLRQIAPCFDPRTDVPILNDLALALIGALPKLNNKEERTDIYDILSLVLPLTEIDEANGTAAFDKLYSQIRGDLGVADDFLFSKTCQALCNLAPLLFGDQFQRLVNDLTGDLKSAGPKLRRSIELLTSLSKSVADRLAPDMPALFDLLFRELSRLDGLPVEEREGDAADEVRTGALEAIANLLGDAFPSIEILEMALKSAAHLVSWDPNYCGDVADVVVEEEGGFTGFDEDDEEGMFEYQSSGFIDETTLADDGCSWKVRRAATRVILAAVISRRDLLGDKILPMLLGKGSGKSLLVTALRDRSHDNKPFALTLVSTVMQLCASQSLGAPASARTVATLVPEAPFIVSELCTIIEKGFHAAPGLECLRTMVRTVGIAEATDFIITAVKSVLNVPLGGGDAKTLGTAMEVAVVLAGTGTDRFASELVPAVAAHAASFRYQVTRDAILALKACLPFVKDAALTEQILAAGLSGLTAAGMDGDCRRAGALLCGAVVAATGSVPQATVDSMVRALNGALQVDANRVAASNALRIIFNKASPSPSASLAADSANELVQHLRKQQLDEREGAAVAMCAVISASPLSIPSTVTDKIMFDVKNSSLLSVEDIRMAVCAFHLIAALASLPKLAGTVVSEVVPSTLTVLDGMVYTPSLHQAVAAAFAALVRSAPSSYDALLAAVSSAFKAIKSDTDGRANLVAIAMGAVVGADTDAARRGKAIKGLLLALREAATGASAATALGEVGRFVEVGSDVVEALCKETQITDVVKIAATRALGFICSGSKATLSSVLARLTNAATTPGLNGVLLRSILVALSLAQDPPVAEVTNAILARSSAHPEVAGECMGRLGACNLPVVVAALQASLVGAVEPHAALVVMAAAKSIVSTDSIPASPANIEALSSLVVTAAKFYSNAADALALRRHSINAYSAIVERRGGRFCTQQINSVLLPHLIGELVEDPNLVSVIDLNTFKQKEDRGVDLRREAFVTLEALIVREGASYTDDAAGGTQCPLINISESQRSDVVARLINACAPRNVKSKKFESPFPVEDVTEINFVARRVLLLAARTHRWVEVLRGEINRIGASLMQLVEGVPEKPPVALPESEKARYPDNIKDACATLRELKNLFPRAASSTAAPQFVEAVRAAAK